MPDPTEYGIEWCRRCHKHQALSAHGGICPVCDPDRSQSAGVQARSDATLDAIDNALTLRPPSVLLDTMRHVSDRMAHNPDPYQAATIDAAFSAPEITTHEVHRVGSTMRYDPYLWHTHRDELWRAQVAELEAHARHEGEWLMGEPDTKVDSVYLPRRVAMPRRWWHKLTIGLWEPSWTLSEGYVHEGETGDADMYEVRMMAYSVDLPPERHPSPEIWQRGTFRSMAPHRSPLDDYRLSLRVGMAVRPPDRPFRITDAT